MNAIFLNILQLIRSFFLYVTVTIFDNEKIHGHYHVVGMSIFEK